MLLSGDKMESIKEESKQKDSCPSYLNSESDEPEISVDGNNAGEVTRLPDIYQNRPQLEPVDGDSKHLPAISLASRPAISLGSFYDIDSSESSDEESES